MTLSIEIATQGWETRTQPWTAGL